MSKEITNDLHSEKLNSHYGKIHVQILRQTEFIRIAVLKDEKDIIRTFAVTFFSDKRYSPELQKIDSQIKKGDLIGETIRRHGFDVVKKSQLNFLLLGNILPFFEETKLLQGQFSKLFIRKENQEDEFYGEVCEIYCHDFKTINNNSRFSKSKQQLIDRVKEILKITEFKDSELIITN